MTSSKKENTTPIGFKIWDLLIYLIKGFGALLFFLWLLILSVLDR